MRQESDLFTQVSEVVDRKCAEIGNSKILLACSGGADSTFLARACVELIPDAVVRIVNHCHRSGSEADAENAKSLLCQMGYEANILAPQEKSVAANEADLRKLRYSLLQQEANSLGAGLILMAHTADDVAETVLLRLLRGTGLRGLGGIPRERKLESGLSVFRPMLSLRRSEVHQALRAVGQAWVEDPTNADPSAAARNALRHEVLPVLEKVSTGDPVKAVLRLAGEAQEWQGCLPELLDAQTDWRLLPSYLRRQALASHLRDMQQTVSLSRLKDLEGALLKKGSAGIDSGSRFSIAGGKLRVVDLP